jgi:hypothetical protein
MRQVGDYCSNSDDDVFERQLLVCLMNHPSQHWIADSLPVMLAAMPGREINAMTLKANVGLQDLTSFLFPLKLNPPSVCSD